MKNLAYLVILNQDDQPIFQQIFDVIPEAFELQLIAFSCLDYFLHLRAQQRTTGFLGSHCVGDDIYFAYGAQFGTKIKVITLLKNYQEHDDFQIQKLTKEIHEIYLKDQMNPFKKQSELFTQNLPTMILQYAQPISTL